jgi:hypothetical protein
MKMSVKVHLPRYVSLIFKLSRESEELNIHVVA